MRFPFDTTIERGDDEIELRVIYDVTPFIAATGPTYSCGGQPAEGGECEIISVKCGGKPFDLTDAEEAAILRECEERCQSDIAEEDAAEADWRYQEYRDRILMDQWENRT